MLMKVYHRTDHADAILGGGFRDAQGSYGLEGLVLRGAWISDVPLDANEGAHRARLLGAEIPEHRLLDYEIVEEGKRYREFCVPSEILNQYSWIVTEEE